jgi:serine/threonine protein kinase
MTRLAVIEMKSLAAARRSFVSGRGPDQGSPGGRPAQSPQRDPGLRHHRRGRLPLDRHGAASAQDAARHDQAGGAAQSAAGGRRRPWGPRRAARGARRGRHAPGRQAGQHPGHCRPGGAHRLRHRPGDRDLTTADVLVGSPSYIAPERARGGQSGPSADLWALGATLYAAVQGRAPFDRDGGALASLTAAVADEPEPATQAGPLLWPVIGGLLHKDPAARLDGAIAEAMLRRAAAVPCAPAAAAVPRPWRSPVPAPARTRQRGQRASSADERRDSLVYRRSVTRSGVMTRHPRPGILGV